MSLCRRPARRAAGHRRALIAACLMAVAHASGACVSPGCAVYPGGGADGTLARSTPRGGAEQLARSTPARRSLSTCELPGQSSYFSAVTDGPAQIAGEKNKGAVHIGGQLTLSPFYSQKVCVQMGHSTTSQALYVILAPTTRPSSLTMMTSRTTASLCSRTLAGRSTPPRTST